MLFNHTLSAILRGRWLLDKQWADAHMPLVLRMMKGENVDFGFSQNTLEEPEIDQWVSLSADKNVYSVRPSSQLSSLPNSSIAVVNLEGPMMKRGGLCSYGMVDQASLIRNLAASSNVDGIILNIDSPGGQADGTAMLGEIIRQASKSKPVVAVINDGMAASAAMWLASAAQEIFVTQPTDQVGSIGVYTKITDWNTHYREFMKLNVQEIYAPQSTEKNKDYRDALNGDTSAIEQDLAVLADQFINTVAANRAGKIKGDAWKTGKMFYANDAKKIGLIDGIKSFDQVVERTRKLSKNPTKEQQNQSNKPMAFEKTLTIAQAKSFAVTDEGFALDEAHLNNIETELTRLDLVETALTAANSTLAATQAQLDTAKADLAAASATALVNATRVTGLEAQVAGLEAQVAELGKESSGTGSVLTKDKDETAEAPKMPAYLSDDAPENAWADKHMRGKKTAA